VFFLYLLQNVGWLKNDRNIWTFRPLNIWEKMKLVSYLFQHILIHIKNFIFFYNSEGLKQQPQGLFNSSRRYIKSPNSNSRRGGGGDGHRLLLLRAAAAGEKKRVQEQVAASTAVHQWWRSTPPTKSTPQLPLENQQQQQIQVSAY
jgi:hypothetical protein